MQKRARFVALSNSLQIQTLRISPVLMTTRSCLRTSTQRPPTWRSRAGPKSSSLCSFPIRSPHSSTYRRAPTTLQASPSRLHLA